MISVKGQYVEADLLTASTETRYPRGSDVWMIFGQMRVKHENLAAVGVTHAGKTTSRCSALSAQPSSRRSRRKYSTHVRLQLVLHGLRDPTLRCH